jgi:hypothetical protein
VGLAMSFVEICNPGGAASGISTLKAPAGDGKVARNISTDPNNLKKLAIFDCIFNSSV